MDKVEVMKLCVLCGVLVVLGGVLVLETQLFFRCWDEWRAKVRAREATERLSRHVGGNKGGKRR